MHALDELFRVQALDAHSANQIREGVLAGSIMLLECGVRIPGDELVIVDKTAAEDSQDLQYLELKRRNSL